MSNVEYVKQKFTFGETLSRLIFPAKFQCQKCNYRYQVLRGLQTHIRFVHEGSMDKLF